MNFGFFNQEGCPVSVPKRSHLAMPYVQHELRAAHRARALLKCCCGGGHLDTFALAGYDEVLIDLRRVSTTDPHVTGCFARERGFFLVRPPVVWAGGAFDPPTTNSDDGLGLSDIGRPPGKFRYGSFTGLGHDVFARASMRAFRAVNVGKTYRDADLRGFRTADIHHALRHQLSQSELIGGESLESMLKRKNREIIWGFSEKPLAQFLGDSTKAESDVRVRLSKAYSIGDGQPRSLLLRVPLAVASKAGGRCRVVGDYIPAPYFIMAVIDRVPIDDRLGGERLVSRVIIIPVASMDAPFAVESRFERAFVLKLHAEGAAFLKPSVHYALGELGADFWPFGLGPLGRLPHRPDLFHFTGGQCRLVELAGFDDPEYLLSVDLRLETMVRSAASSDVVPDRVLRKEFKG